MALTDKIDYLLKEKGMNKKNLSDATGIPYTTLDGFYKRGTENIKIGNLRIIRDYFGTTYDYLLDDDIPVDYYIRAAEFTEDDFNKALEYQPTEVYTGTYDYDDAAYHGAISDVKSRPLLGKIVSNISDMDDDDLTVLYKLSKMLLRGAK